MENENEIRKAFIFPDGVTHGAEKNEKNVLLSCPFNDKGLNISVTQASRRLLHLYISRFCMLREGIRNWVSYSHFSIVHICLIIGC
jgi:hypothetical protein